MTISASKFNDYLLRHVQEFDAQLLQDMTPTDPWIGKIKCGPIAPDWFEVREMVRKISEGSCYEPEEFISEDSRICEFVNRYEFINR